KIRDVRGTGLIIGIEMDSPETASYVQRYMRDNGVLVNVCHGKVVRLIPPLILQPEHVARFMYLFKKAIQ
ncbi:MAG: aminotransferase class III-fold pyridoxal phosphate-dependent enzyme, partial [Candidatus Methanomethylophilaceae archaeon]